MAQLIALGVRDRVYALKEVSTLPSTLVRILSIVQDDGANALDLAEVVGSDQALTLRILGTVNSSYYGFHRQIRTVPDAVVILGFDEVERLALAISVIHMFGRDPASARALKMLWRHSIACSVVTGCIETHLRSRKPQIAGAHVAGLLHDIGKAVIAQQFPEAMASVLRLIEDDGYSHTDAEREILDGYTHCDIGAWLAGRWSLPPAIVESIELHHAPSTLPNPHLLTHATHVADVLCNRFGIRSTNANASCEFEAASADAIGLDESLLAHIEERLDRQRGLIGAMATGGIY